MTHASVRDGASGRVDTGSRPTGALLGTTRKTAGKKAGRIATVLSYVYVGAVVAILGSAYLVREEEYIIPKHGTGYWLGIAGGLILLFLLLYPLRKKRAKDAKYGSIATWFQWHMILGILGPTLILLHSNFQLKSVNATVATVIMLTVVASGVIGRFLYRKVHKDLYDTKAEVTALLFEADTLYDAFGEEMQWAPAILEQLRSFEQRIGTPHVNPLQSLIFIVRIAIDSRLSHHRVAAASAQILKHRALVEGWPPSRLKQMRHSVSAHLEEYYDTVRKAAELKLYNRLLAVWHVLHLPLFLLLIVAAIVHIVAVHLY